MSFASLTIRCTGCRGRGVVMDSDGNVQRCPTCNGSGIAAMRVKRTPYDYVFPQISVSNVAGTINLAELQLDDDSFFELVAWVANDVSNNGCLYTLQVVDTSNGWQFSNTGLFQISTVGAGLQSNFASKAVLPFPLVSPYIFSPSSSVQIAAQTISGGPSGVDVTMKGFKLYAPDGSALNLDTAQQQQGVAA